MWQLLLRHVPATIAAGLAGFAVGSYVTAKNSEEEILRGRIETLIAEKAEAKTLVKERTSRVKELLEQGREEQERTAGERERLQAAISRARNLSSSVCPAVPSDVASMRVVIDAANRFAIRDVSRGTSGEGRSD